MKFREWLAMDETRYKGLMRQWRNQHPNVPDYVLHQMYINHISPNMRTAMRNSQTPIEPTMIDLSTPHPDGNQVPAGRMPTLKQSFSPHSTNLVQNIIRNKNYVKNVEWIKEPVVVDLHPLDLDPTSLYRLVYVRFGFRPQDMQIRQDSQRFNTHRQLATAIPQGANEPIILIKASADHYELLEGYHRAASYLLQGAPPEEIEKLRHGDIANLDFTKWQPIKIKAYVGIRNQDGQDMDGYSPATS
jgi:hypothetical protein